MTQAALNGEIARCDGTSVTITFVPRGPGASKRTTLQRRMAVMLDGAFAGSFEITLGGADPITVTWPLPRHRLAQTIDIVDVALARSILSAPFDLTPAQGLVVDHLGFAGNEVVGRFRLAADLDPVLPIMLRRDDHPPIHALATRSVAPGGRAPVKGRRKPTSDHVYEFAAPLAALCPIGQSYRLALSISGRAAPENGEIEVNAQAIGCVGYIDRADNGLVCGWAADLRTRNRRLAVDLVRDGHVIASATADELRPDIASLGVTDGHSAFTFQVPHVMRGEPDVAYSVYLSGTRTQLCNSPALLGPSMRLIGFFDEVQGGIAVGWICDLDNPDTPIEIEIVCGETVLARTLANGFRGDVQQAGIPASNCGFRISLGAAFRDNLGREVFVRPVGTPIVLAGSPKVLTENPNLGRFLDRAERLDEGKLTRLRRRLNHRAGLRQISIIMPVYNTRQEWLVEALESVRAQWCDNWELICIDDASTAPHVAAILSAYARHDQRFRVLRSPQNVGIARATNFGLRAARHDYVTFMDHDDYLEPDAIYCLLHAIETTGADFLYTDEVLTYDDIRDVMEVRARPSFSHDYYMSHPYFVHMLCVRTQVAQRVGGWDERMPISADIDFVLRVIEVANAVAHVPAVLYRWRTHSTSTGHSKQSQVMEASKGAIQRHLARSGITATVRDGVYFNQFRLDWPSDDGEILIVIPTKNKTDLLKTCIDSIERTSKGVQYRIVVIDHQSDEAASRRYLKSIAAKHTVMPYAGEFNFARMNNVAVRKHGNGARYILFLNNDIEAIEPGWLDRLRSLANRPEIGAAGPLLLYGDKRVQHAGVIIGFNNAAEHVMKFADAWIENGARRNLGYNCTLSSVRDFSAVTAACMMLRRAVFEEVGGFDEVFAIGFNDTDLCLRIVQAGYRMLYDGNTILFHHESATRSLTKQVVHLDDDNLLRQRWRRYFVEGDPFYNPILDLRMNDHTLRSDGACKRIAPARVTQLRAPPVPTTTTKKRRLASAS